MVEVKEECCSCVALKMRIKQLEEELLTLKFPHGTEKPAAASSFSETTASEKAAKNFVKCNLPNADIMRFSRQILLPEINPNGQENLSKSSALVVGVGGLGCPAALYLAAGGVSRIGLVDFDTVTVSNLQRQVLHGEDTEGFSKVESGMQKLKQINSSLQCDTYNVSLSSSNCMDIIRKYDIVLDCSDNVATRYLLNDACLKANKPLLSGSALRWEGQLTVYNYNNGPCYRCLYPMPPPPETVTNCSDAGVVGAITGVIGTLQALEMIKIATGNDCSFAGKLLLYDGLAGSFRTVKLRGKVKGCLCNTENRETIQLVDYEEFCGSAANDKEKRVKLLSGQHRVSVKDYHENILLKDKPHILLDVRPTVEYVICSLEDSINMPISDIMNGSSRPALVEWLAENRDIFVFCKVGNDSQRAVREVLKLVEENGLKYTGTLKDVIGGLVAWSNVIDSKLPIY